jgi:hypothetical protein
MQVAFSEPDPQLSQAIDCHRMEFSYPATKRWKWHSPRIEYRKGI